MWAPWIIALVLVLLWVTYAVLGQRESVSYFLFFVAGMGLMATPAGQWLTWVCGGYTGSPAAAVICLVMCIVWVAHLGIGSTLTWNYLWFFFAIVSFSLTKYGVLFLGSFHH
jgi:hypothetical protein